MFKLNNKNAFNKHSFIKGLYLMGSRVEGDFYRFGNYSDVDCCVIVAYPIGYKKIYEIIYSEFPRGLKVELCPRTELQIETKNKFNFDLKYLSKIIFIRDEDLREKIPVIKISDFSQHDFNNVIFISIEFLLLSLFTYLKKKELSQSIIYLEKSFRKISLHINLKNKVYPVRKYWFKNDRLFERYKMHENVLYHISKLRETMDLDRIAVEDNYNSLITIIFSELLKLNNSCNRFDTKEIAKILVDPELQSFACSVLDIFIYLAKMNPIFPLKKTLTHDSQMVKEKFIQKYYNLMNRNGYGAFCPPKIINGGYHVFK